MYDYIWVSTDANITTKNHVKYIQEEEKRNGVASTSVIIILFLIHLQTNKN